MTDTYRIFIAKWSNIRTDSIANMAENYNSYLQTTKNSVMIVHQNMNLFKA